MCRGSSSSTWKSWSRTWQRAAVTLHFSRRYGGFGIFYNNQVSGGKDWRYWDVLKRIHIMIADVLRLRLCGVRLTSTGVPWRIRGPGRAGFGALCATQMATGIKGFSEPQMPMLSWWDWKWALKSHLWIRLSVCDTD